MAHLFSKKSKTKPFEQFFGDISMRLIPNHGAASATSIEAILRDIGERYGADRAHMRWAPPNEPGMEAAEFDTAASWNRPGRTPGKEFAAQEVPWCLAKLRAGEVLCFHDLEDMPEEAAADRQALRARGIDAMLVLSLMMDDDMLGVFSMSTRTPFHWSETIQDEARPLAAIFTNYFWGAHNRTKLRDSEAHFRGVVQDMSDMIVRWTPDGKTTWVNDRICEIGRAHV